MQYQATLLRVHDLTDECNRLQRLVCSKCEENEKRAMKMLQEAYRIAAGVER
jgi:hypothetical protein